MSRIKFLGFAPPLPMTPALARGLKCSENKSDWIRSWQEHGRTLEFSGSYDWLENHLVVIHKVSSIPEQAVDAVIEGMSYVSKKIGAPLIFERTHNISLEGCVNDGVINYRTLSNHLVTSRKRPQADVVLTNQSFSEADWWGCSNYEPATMVFALKGLRSRAYSFIRKNAAHETGHLFGFNQHHPEKNISGYDFSPKETPCTMKFECDSSLCVICQDTIQSIYDQSVLRSLQNQ